MIEETESYDVEDFVVGDGLSFAFHNFESIPTQLAKSTICAKARRVDLTETYIKNLENLSYFQELETLVLDKNDLTGLENCPMLPTVRTLWCNNNLIVDLPAFMDAVVEKFPYLQYLSIMRNPACPGLTDFCSPDLEALRLYRMYILYRYPLLEILDWTEVSEEERREAELRGKYAVKRKVKSNGSENDPPIGDDFVALLGHEAQEAIAAAGGGPTAKPASFKGKITGYSPKKFEARNSEGNRFIVNSQL